MNWKTIRLELGRTPDYPAGSPGRSYLVRLPLHACGAVDEEALSVAPSHATVRRFWPSEPDRSGTLERTVSGWAIQCSRGRNMDRIGLIDRQPIRLGEQVMITQADGKRLPFRVASIRATT